VLDEQVQQPQEIAPVEAGGALHLRQRALMEPSEPAPRGAHLVAGKLAAAVQERRAGQVARSVNQGAGSRGSVAASAACLLEVRLQAARDVAVDDEADGRLVAA